MWYVLISVICSVTVAVVIKLAKQRGIKHLHLIVWNYPVAALMTWIFLDPDGVEAIKPGLPWSVYSTLAILLPSIFLCIAYAIQYSGIVKTEIAQRLSLFIPLLAAYFIFHEALSSFKLVGIAVGFSAIVLTIAGRKAGPQSASGGKWGYALAVFLGMGVIDILFKQIALFKDVSYAFSMLVVFLLAMVVSFLFLAYDLIANRTRLKIRSIGWGILLGMFNFGNILFYMKAHRALSESPSVVFTGMNIGVILLGAVVGTIAFGERLSVMSRVGLVLAVISVLIIAYL
ncbi:DMT family transporter [Sphingobacterium paludis]|uniref:EamA-like transporter family protein n=1 Tax=Sphingobacterium paludis TaxID=1476465 RepID=A0A4R7CUT9_9SPHI|nr:DMT family transporter [Sphingobacterium paludis]TDS12213.1 EamA-like transporter family protein [Sphingobacterium paludis]